MSRAFDAAIIDMVVVQGGSGGFRGTGGKGGIDNENDAGMNDAPCTPNCPELEWVTIPGGAFMMASPGVIGNYPEPPPHEVAVQTFKMSKTEITVSQYGICVDAGICSEPISPNSARNNWISLDRENHPINAVTWFETKEFAEWIGARLPSEVEWEYAARSGGRDIIYPWGNEEPSCEYAVILEDESGNDCGNETTMEVCSKPLGDTAQGLCDMAGNVLEWVEDNTRVAGFLTTSRVLCGGSFLDVPSGCRSASRAGDTPNSRGVIQGFRVVLDLK